MASLVDKNFFEANVPDRFDYCDKRSSTGFQGCSVIVDLLLKYFNPIIHNLNEKESIYDVTLAEEPKENPPKIKEWPNKGLLENLE